MNRRALLILGAGTALGWPLIARAQQKAMPVIGYLSLGSPGPAASWVAAFRQGLSETGYVEGQSVRIDYRWAKDDYDRLPALAADLVGRKVDVIVTFGGPLPTLAAKSATSTIPIVFLTGADPVVAGIVGSFARPGGNLTGASMQLGELMPKRLELLSELVPSAKAIALLVNPNNAASAETMMRGVQKEARAEGVKLLILKASTDAEIDTAFASLADLQAGSLLVSADLFFDSQRERLVALAARHAIPTMYILRDYAAAGGLISYGPSVTDMNRIVGGYVGKILNGAKPADLPVQQPTRFELVINLKTAKTLHLAVPQTLLQRADEVIE